MSDAMLNIILALIGLLGTIIVYVIVPYYKSKVSKEQRENIEFWTKTAVLAIEKYYEHITGKGFEKKQFVMDFIMKQNLNITEDQLSVLIDSIVEECINRPKKELDKD